MLVAGESLINTPVMSLQTGAQIAHTIQPVIDPATLLIVAYEVDGQTLEERPSFIRIEDIRELSSMGMIVDSSDELIGKNDVIKITSLFELGFTLRGMVVIDERKRKIGKVIDYTVDTDFFSIQQLDVKGGLFWSITNTSSVIHRSQITEITDTTITVKSTDQKLTTLATDPTVHRTYSNPFRKPVEQQPDSPMELS